MFGSQNRIDKLTMVFESNALLEEARVGRSPIEDSSGVEYELSKQGNECHVHEGLRSMCDISHQKNNQVIGDVSMHSVSCPGKGCDSDVELVDSKEDSVVSFPEDHSAIVPYIYIIGLRVRAHHYRLYVPCKSVLHYTYVCNMIIIRRRTQLQTSVKKKFVYNNKSFSESTKYAI